MKSSGVEDRKRRRSIYPTPIPFAHPNTIADSHPTSQS